VSGTALAATVTATGIETDAVATKVIKNVTGATDVKIQVGGVTMLTINGDGMTTGGDLYVTGALVAPNFAMSQNYTFTNVNAAHVVCTSLSVGTSGSAQPNQPPIYVATANTSNVSIYAAGSITALSSYHFSDARAKRDVERLDPAAAVDVIRRLRPSSYRFKQQQGRKMGLIAQELETVLPSCVERRTEFLPDLLLPARVLRTDGCGGVSVSFRVPSSEPDDAETPATLFVGASIGVRHVASGVRVCAKVGASTDTVLLLEAGDDKSAATWKTGDELLLIGTRVDDFRVVDYEQVLMCLVAAVQTLIPARKTLNAGVKDA
jgi:hypothetical protein